MRSVKQCLNKQLTELCRGAMNLEKISAKVSQFLPDNLKASCHVGSFNNGCLILATTDAAWATQLRYALPELRDKLRKDAGLYQLSSIKISIIEPSNDNTQLKPDQSTHLSEKAKTIIIKESEQCSYQPLKKALLNLAHGE